MITQEMLEQFGRLLRAARRAKKLSQEEVAEAMSVSQAQYCDLERIYVRKGKVRSPVPDDDFLASASAVLGIPVIKLHTVLGRIPDGAAAQLLVREHLALYNGEGTNGAGKVSREQVESLAQELDDIARVRVERVMREAQEGGKQKVA